MDNQTVDRRPKTCPTCGRSRTWDKASCQYCSNQEGHTVADTEPVKEVEAVKGCWSPQVNLPVIETTEHCSRCLSIPCECSKLKRVGPLPPVNPELAAKLKDDAIGKQLGELDWQAERAHPAVKGKVTRNDILGWHRQICEEARDLAVRKNRDYAADADPLRNFRLSSQTAGISMSQCALVYLGENVAKYRSFIENGGKSAVKTEKLIDHIRDSINFNILLYAILIDEGYFVHEEK